MSNEEIIEKWSEGLIESFGPEFRDIYFKPEDLALRGEDQTEFLKDLYGEAFRDAFIQLGLHYDNFKEHIAKDRGNG